MSAEQALLAAVHDALLAHGALAALVGARVYDDAPPEAMFPYITMGRVETRPSDASNAEALEHVVTLHAWSRYGGRAEALSIVAAIRDALHHAALDIEARRLVLLLVTFTDVFRSGDGRTTHGVVRLRAVTEAE